MTTFTFVDGGGSLRYVDIDGSGSAGDPYKIKGTNSAAVLAALQAIQAAVEAGPTEAKQDTGNTALAAIQAATTAGATAANQATANTALAAIVAAVQAATPPGEYHTGEVGGSSALIKPTIAVSTTPAYTAGDSIGGKLTLANALRVSGGTAIWQSLTILDRANQKPSGYILIYNADPTLATLTDNAAFAHSTDDSKIVAMLAINTSDYATIGGRAEASKAVGLLVKAATGTTLYAAFVASGTPTFVATTDIELTFGFLRD